MKKVIMTGGSGFIGSHLINELVSRNIEVTVLTSSPEKIIQNPLVTIINRSLINKNNECDCTYDTFYHLGWNGVAGEFKNKVDYQIDNIISAVNMFELSKKIGCKRFITTGTVAEYTCCKEIDDFSVKQSPNDLYGATKVAVHYILEAMAKHLNHNLIWAVVPSTFGEGRIGNNILTYTILSCLRKQKPIYGALEQMWDFLYVTEVARALYLIGEYGKDNMTYGIGSGKYRQLKSYIETIRDMIDPELSLGIGELPTLRDSVFNSCVNIDLLTRDTGFIPKVSFEEGIEKTILYYSKYIEKEERKG